jgi:hypothetical protein
MGERLLLNRTPHDDTGGHVPRLTTKPMLIEADFSSVLPDDMGSHRVNVIISPGRDLKQRSVADRAGGQRTKLRARSARAAFSVEAPMTSVRLMPRQRNFDIVVV